MPATSSVCRDPQSTSEMAQCAQQKYEAANKQLNAMWEQVKLYLTTGDSGGTDESKETFRRVQVAQRAWLPFRDATCQAEVDNIGGTLERVEVPGCLARLTRERTRYLRQWTASAEQ